MKCMHAAVLMVSETDACSLCMPNCSSVGAKDKTAHAPEPVRLPRIPQIPHLLHSNVDGPSSWVYLTLPPGCHWLCPTQVLNTCTVQFSKGPLHAQCSLSLRPHWLAGVQT